jgi:hypothetical protein
VGWRRSTGVEERWRRRAAAGGDDSGEWRGRVGDGWSGGGGEESEMDEDTQVTRASHDTLKR